MSLRRLFVLVSQLPIDSRTKAKLRGDRAGRRWGEALALQADMHELLQLIRSEQLASIPTKEKTTLPEFQKIERPDLDDVEQDDVDEGDGPAESPAERYARIQRFLSRFDPPAAEAGR